MATATKRSGRTWGQILSLGVPLAVVGVSAMAISYATLIDVAKVNGLPLPELFPVLIDVGTVAAMVAAAQFRVNGLKGRWLAYTTFVALSVVSIVANSTHAGRAADLTMTTAWAAALLAATPPAALLAITHLVMMLIPDEKERAKIQAAKEEAAAVDAKRTEPQLPTQPPLRVVTRDGHPRGEAIALTPRPHVSAMQDKRETVTAPYPDTQASTQVMLDTGPVLVPELAEPVSLPMSETEAGTTPVVASGEVSADWVGDQVLAFIREHGKKPTGAMVGEWLGGKSPKTGQRFLRELTDTGPVPISGS